MDWEVWVFRIVFVAFVGGFLAQMSSRLKLIQAAPNNFTFDHIGARFDRFISEIIFQSKVISDRKAVGIAHLAVFWGFVAFGGFTTVEMLRGLGIVDLTHTTAFFLYKVLLLPFAVGVFLGIVGLAIRRGIVRPAGLGATVSKESLLIALFIAMLMVTYFISFVYDADMIGRVNWWTHMLIILVFMVLVPNSKHLHLILSRRCF